MSKTVVVALEFRFFRGKDQSIYTDSVFGPEFWARYLRIFDSVIIVARAQDVDEINSQWTRVDTEQIQFMALPYYIGPKQMLLKLGQINTALDQVARLDHAFILRVPGLIGMLLYRKLLGMNKNYALEVVGDPYDVFQPGSFKSKLTHVYRWLFARELKRKCQKAACVSYVTKSTLQKRYPAVQDAYTTHYSSVELPDYFYHDIKRTFDGQGPKRLLFVGSLAQKYKGLHVLLTALSEVNKSNQDWSLSIIGDGGYKSEYEQMSDELGLQENVVFFGYESSREKLYEYFCNADIFVLPSLTEGLPRVVIEAMATGLPVIASAVGGVPELVDENGLVEPDEPVQLEKKLTDFMSSPVRLLEYSMANRHKAEDYRTDKLQQRRNDFFARIMTLTEQKH